jgi:hypothetical protein
MKNWPHDRSHYRIEYPRRARPVLELDEVKYSVVDCSENGIRFKSGGVTFQRGDPVAGVIRFPGRGETPVAGVVVRVQEGHVALLLEETGIPFPMILSEQRYLRANYVRWPASILEDDEEEEEPRMLEVEDP